MDKLKSIFWDMLPMLFALIAFYFISEYLLEKKGCNCGGGNTTGGPQAGAPPILQAEGNGAVNVQRM